VVPTLREILDDASEPAEIKLVAAGALGRLARHPALARQAVASLIRAISDSPPAVVDAAHACLKEATGKDLPKEYGPWRDWWQTAGPTFAPRAPVAAGDAGEEPQQESDRPGTSFYGIMTRSKHIVYILDRSGSMNQNDAAGGDLRINAAKKELLQSIRSLPEDATFNIIFYNHEFDVWQKKMTTADKASKSAAVKWIEEIDAVGATNIFDPLEHAFLLAGRGTHDKRYGVTLDTIFFLSDGRSNRGRLISADQILKEIERMNELKKVKIHAIGIGSGGGSISQDRGHDEHFMRALAEMTDGTYVAR
jgi:hypothetical protein